MTKLNITFKPSSRFPVYAKYTNQYNAQPAFIALDLETGELDADYRADISGCSGREWNNILLTFAIHPESTSDEISEIIEKNKESFQEILDGASIEWNGSNRIGKLNLIAQSIRDSLDRDGDGFKMCKQEGGRIDSESFGEWLDAYQYPNQDQTLNQFANELYSCDGNDGYYFSEELNSSEAIKSKLLCLWSENLYGGEDIPKHVAQILLDEGACEGSAWMDELRSFAK